MQNGPEFYVVDLDEVDDEECGCESCRVATSRIRFA